MRAVLRFFFGTGWWVPWHLMLWLTLVPLVVSLDWFTYMVPGAGPQGGDAIFAFLLLVVTALIFYSLVDFTLWASTLNASWARRYLGVPALVLVAWAGLIALLIWLLDLATGTDVSAPARKFGWIATIAVFAAIYLANLWAIARFRAYRSKR